MALRNVFGNLALDTTVQSIVAWLTASTGSKTTANSVSVTVASDQTVPVSVASLPLPSGAATSSNQSTTNTLLTSGNSSLTSIDSKIPTLNSGRVPVDVGGATLNINGNVVISNEVEVTNDVGNPLPINAISLPLPNGAARADNQVTGNASLASLDSKVPLLVAGRVPVDGSGVTQPVSASSLPLPSGASTSSNQATGNASLASIDSKLPVLSTGRVPVDGPLTDTQLRATVVGVAPNISRGTGVMDANTTRVALATDSPAVSALTSLDTKTPALVNGRQPVDGSGVTQPISAATLPLPTGASTAANQSTGNTSLSNINAGIGAPSDGVATSDTGTFSLLALAKRGLTNWTTLLSRLPSLTVTSSRLLVDGSGVTQPVSGSVSLTGTSAISATSLPLPSGAATSTLQSAGKIGRAHV